MQRILGQAILNFPETQAVRFFQNQLLGHEIVTAIIRTYEKYPFIDNDEEFFSYLEELAEQ